MIKAAVIISAILLLAGIAAASTFTGIAPSSETPTLSIPDAATTGGTTTEETTTVGTTTDREPGEDMPGPCDEAEHADDPRCTGVGGVRTDRDDGRRGPNRGPGRGDDDRRDDNSGPGSSSSGPGHGGDGDRENNHDDNPGPGSGDDHD
jgi:hypothetical protein